MDDSIDAPIILKLPGEWDIARKEELRALLSDAQDRAFVIIDLTEATYIDSTVLGQIAALQNARELCGLSVPRIAMSGGNVLRLFTVVSFERIFPLFPSVAAALDDLFARDTDAVEGL